MTDSKASVELVDLHLGWIVGVDVLVKENLPVAKATPVGYLPNSIKDKTKPPSLVPLQFNAK